MVVVIIVVALVVVVEVAAVTVAAVEAMVKVKQPHYRPGLAQRVPRS